MATNKRLLNRVPARVGRGLGFVIALLGFCLSTATFANELHCFIYSEDPGNNFQLELYLEEVNGELFVAGSSKPTLGQWQQLTQTGSSQDIQAHCETAEPQEVGDPQALTGWKSWLKRPSQTTVQPHPVGISDDRGPMDGRGPQVQSF